jgi:hypothetical protein
MWSLPLPGDERAGWCGAGLPDELLEEESELSA